MMKKALPQSSILNLEDYQLWPAPGHLLSLQGLPLLSKEPFIHPSGRRLRHGFHDTKCSPTREPPLHTAYAAGLSTRLSNIHSKAGIHTFRKNQVFGITVLYTRGCHTASRFSRTATCPVRVKAQDREGHMFSQTGN